MKIYKNFNSHIKEEWINTFTNLDYVGLYQLKGMSHLKYIRNYRSKRSLNREIGFVRKVIEKYINKYKLILLKMVYRHYKNELPSEEFWLSLEGSFTFEVYVNIYNYMIKYKY